MQFSQLTRLDSSAAGPVWSGVGLTFPGKAVPEDQLVFSLSFVAVIGVSLLVAGGLYWNVQTDYSACL